jgi:hypothetical protein
MKDKVRDARFLSGAFSVVAVVLSLVGCRQQTSSEGSRRYRTSDCYHNLQYIEVAKMNWAIDYEKTSTNMPAWKDLQPYLPDEWSNSIPQCPSGGTYTIGRTGDLPTCSIGGSGHMLYK